LRQIKVPLIAGTIVRKESRGLVVLPFTPDQFLAVFVNYNTAIWPIQIGAYLLGGVALALLFRKSPGADRAITGILAAMWLWTGLAYHALFFSAINKAAYLFAALFFIQGGSLIYAGMYHDQIRFSLRPGLATWAGWLFIAYAAILYPLISLSTGHRYPEMPMFGVTPCTVTIFTFGFLLLTTPPLSRWLLVVPSVWSLIGGSAAILLHVPQDWLLLASGFVAVPLIVSRNRETT
jgi:hypothetical protein